MLTHNQQHFLQNYDETTKNAYQPTRYLLKFQQASKKNHLNFNKPTNILTKYQAMHKIFTKTSKNQQKCLLTNQKFSKITLNE